MTFPVPGPPHKRPTFEEVIEIVKTMTLDDRARLRVALIARYDVRGHAIRGYQSGDPEPKARDWGRRS